MTVDFISQISFDIFSVELSIVDGATLLLARQYTDEQIADIDAVKSVTSTDNHIVVDNTDHKNPSLSFQLVDNENLLTDDQLALVESAVQPEDLPIFGDIVTHNANEFSVSNHNHSLANLTEKSYNSLTDKPNLSVFQPKTDNSLETTSKDVVGAINEVNSIALGSQQAVAFNDYVDLVAFLNAVQSGEFEFASYNIGQSIYLLELEIPDLWVTGAVSGEQYTYISDERFIEDILAGAYIGNYQLGLLETGKVDLSNYYTKTESDNTFAPTIHTHSVSDLSDVDGEATTVSTGDSFFMKVGNLWKTITESNFVTWLNTTFFTKTDSDRRFVAQNGGTIYHTTKWFTPKAGQTLTIAANGLSATLANPETNFQFTSGMTGAKLRLTGGVNEPIITYVSSNSITLSFAVDSSFFGQSVAVADWGVYPRAEWSSGGRRVFGDKLTGSVEYAYQEGGNWFGNYFLSGIRSLFTGDAITAIRTFKISWSDSATTLYSTIDTSISRLSAGVVQITEGATNALRDLKLRSLFADKIIPNSDTTGVVIYKADGTAIAETSRLTSLTDSNELIGAGSYIDLETSRSGRGSIVFGDGAGYADFIFTSAGVVTLIQYTSNVFTSVQTGTNHVIIKDNGTNVRIVNEMGSTMNFNVKIQYN